MKESCSGARSSKWLFPMTNAVPSTLRPIRQKLLSCAKTGRDEDWTKPKAGVKDSYRGGYR
jgi:hypothetical protein